MSSSISARGAPPPLALARRRGDAAVRSAASLGPQALWAGLARPTPNSLSLGAAATPRFAPPPRSGRRRSGQGSRGPTPARSRSAPRRRRGSLRRLARAAGALGRAREAHPHSLSLGAAATPRFAPPPRSGRRRSGQGSRGPTPARSRSAPRRRRGSLRRLARAAGALGRARGAPPPLALARRRGDAAVRSAASLGPQRSISSSGPQDFPARSVSTSPADRCRCGSRFSLRRRRFPP